MGGSAFGAHVLLSLYKNSISVALVLVSNYSLPQWVNKDSLVVLSSYSGTTEEILSCGREATERKAMVVGISNGGQLVEFLKQQDYPRLIFAAKNNPCGQPRLGSGYMVLGTIGIVCKLGFLNIPKEEIVEAINNLRKHQEEIQKEAIEIAKQKDNEEIFIIGGGQIYEQGIKYADKLYLTLVKGEFVADTFFPDYSKFRKIVYKQEGKDNKYQYTFLELVRE